MSDDATRLIAETVRKTIEEVDARQPRDVMTQSMCDRRQRNVLDAVKQMQNVVRANTDKLLEVHADVVDTKKTTGTLQIDLTGHLAHHNGVSAGRRSAGSILRVVGAVIGALAACGAIVFTMVQLVGGA